MYTVKVQGNISVLPTPAVNPESLLEGPFSTFAEFERNLHEFERATCAVFRKNNTVSVQTARKYLKHTMPDEIVYHRAQFVCTHFGKPRYRGKGVINHSTTLATGCEAEVVLLWNNHLKKLLVTKKNLTHNHEVNAFTYSQQYKVKRLTNEQKDEIKELIKQDIKIKGHRLRDIINSKYNKCFSLRDASLLKHQLKKAMTPEEKELLNVVPKSSVDHISLDGTERDLPENSSVEQVSNRDSSPNVKTSKSSMPKSKIRRALDPPFLPDPNNVRDMSQFVSYLDASNRMKRRSDDSQIVDLLWSSYMIRKPNILSVKKRKSEVEDILSETDETKELQVMCDLKDKSLIEDGNVHHIVKDLSEDKEVRIIVYKNVGEDDTKQDAVAGSTVDFNSPFDPHESTNKSGADSAGQEVKISGTTHIQQSRNYHFFMDLCHQVDTLDPKTALKARQELSRVVHKYMMANINAHYI